jgi:general secretion pathway protein C
MAATLMTYSKQLMGGLNRFGGWLLLLAIAWLCWAIARLLWLVLAPPQAPMLPVAPLQPAAVSTTDYASSFMIFEQPAAATAPAQPPPNVALKGVMLAMPEVNSAALLDVNGVVKNYRVGSLLESTGYKLIAVAWNEVIIADPSDKQVVITLTQPLALDQGQMAANNGAGQVSNNRLPSGSDLQANAMPNDAVTEATETDSADNSNPQSAITQAVDELKQNPASYLSRMGVMATGEGYQVTAAMPDGLKNRLGLEPGDKVLSVNGQTVGSNPGQDADLLDKVKQSGGAEIEVQRGDQVITIRQQF